MSILDFYVLYLGKTDIGNLCVHYLACYLASVQRLYFSVGNRGIHDFSPVKVRDLGIYNLAHNLVSLNVFDLRTLNFNVFDLCEVYLRYLGVQNLTGNFARMKVLYLGVCNCSVLNLGPIDVCNLGINDLTGDLIRLKVGDMGVLNHRCPNLGVARDKRFSFDQLVRCDCAGRDGVTRNCCSATCNPIKHSKVTFYDNLACTDRSCGMAG